MESSNGSAATGLWTRNLRGPKGQLFGDPMPGSDETAFEVDNTSADYYRSPYYKQHENEVEAVPMGPPTAPLNLEGVLGADFLAPMVAATTRACHRVRSLTRHPERGSITRYSSVRRSPTAISPSPST
jgi:hypothetical protein